MSTPQPKCHQCKKPRTVIRGHEDRDVHPLCDDPNTWWWNPNTGRIVVVDDSTAQQAGGQDG
jgi:hypothetical protein